MSGNTVPSVSTRRSINHRLGGKVAQKPSASWPNRASGVPFGSTPSTTTRIVVVGTSTNVAMPLPSVWLFANA